ncbi:MAG: MlaD family protein, partial [Burkholderiaceae bacterium]
MKRPSATLIGVFVIGALVLIATAIMFFGSGALFKQRFTAVSYFPGSVAGLQIGAPVTYRGVRVGQVKSVGIRIDPDPTRSIVQVNMELLPEAVRGHGNSDTQEALPALVARGLTAQLVLQSFVTGMLQVELDFRPDVKALRLGETFDLPEIPTVPSPYQALTDQLQTLDIAAAVTALQRTLASMDALLTSPALKQTIDGLPALLVELRQTVKTVDREVHSFSATGQRSISETAASLQSTLASVQKLAQDVDREAVSTLTVARGTLQNADTAVDGIKVLVDPRGQTVTQVQDAVDDLAATAARLRD